MTDDSLPTQEHTFASLVKSLKDGESKVRSYLGGCPG